MTGRARHLDVARSPARRAPMSAAPKAAAGEPDGRSTTRCARCSERRNGEAPALAESSAVTSARSRSASAVIPPPSITASTSTVSTSTRTAAATPAASSERSRRASGSPASAASKMSRIGSAPGRPQRSAMAAPPARASMQPRWPLRIDGDVADLSRGAAPSAPQLAVHDDPGGDARSEVQVGHGVAGDQRRRDVTRHPGRVRVQGEGAERRRLDVVLHPDGDPEHGLQHGREVEFGDPEVDGVQHARGAGLDLARHPDAHRAHRGDVGALARQGGDGVRHDLRDGLRPPARRETHACDDGAGVVDGHRVGLGAADVESHSHEPSSRQRAAIPCPRISP